MPPLTRTLRKSLHALRLSASKEEKLNPTQWKLTLEREDEDDAEEFCNGHRWLTQNTALGYPREIDFGHSLWNRIKEMKEDLRKIVEKPDILPRFGQALKILNGPTRMLKAPDGKYIKSLPAWNSAQKQFQKFG
jgi:hypothetical protein